MGSIGNGGDAGSSSQCRLLLSESHVCRNLNGGEGDVKRPFRDRPVVERSQVKMADRVVQRSYGGLEVLGF